MSRASSAEHIPFDALVDYWLDEHGESPLEAHLLACGVCTDRLAWLAGLAAEIRGVIKRGEATMIMTAGMLRQLAAEGMRIREYRLQPGGSVNCTIAAADDLVVAHLEAPLAGVSRLDLVAITDGVLQRIDDIPFDAAGGEIVIVPRTADLRALGRATQVATLVAVGPEGATRVIGEYTFNHRPFTEQSEAPLGEGGR
jgi:hypothetical protein